MGQEPDGAHTADPLEPDGLVGHLVQETLEHHAEPGAAGRPGEPVDLVKILEAGVLAHPTEPE